MSAGAWQRHEVYARLVLGLIFAGRASGLCADGVRRCRCSCGKLDHPFAEFERILDRRIRASLVTHRRANTGLRFRRDRNPCGRGRRPGRHARRNPDCVPRAAGHRHPRCQGFQNAAGSRTVTCGAPCRESAKWTTSRPRLSASTAWREGRVGRRVLPLTNSHFTPSNCAPRVSATLQGGARFGSGFTGIAAE
jgi:hypothetical protein